MINTEEFSKHLRLKTINSADKTILITDFTGSAQEEENPEKINCHGLGRIRTFRRHGSPLWPSNPLPIDPAIWKLGLPDVDAINAQVFQSASCNWRCWYCYVPFHLLNGSLRHGKMLSSSGLLDLYQAEPDRPRIIDLSGGQPDLTPEWTVWMIQEILDRGLSDAIYLWSDDNLSNDYFWTHLTPADIDCIRGFRNYGRVCCFKGYDDESFAFNTGAAPELFANQFQHFRRYVEVGIDVYGYATFTSPHINNVETAMRHFVDRIQEISENLPLRIVPLEVQVFTAVNDRVSPPRKLALANQWVAIECWKAEINRRFSSSQLSLRIHDVAI